MVKILIIVFVFHFSIRALPRLLLNKGRLLLNIHDTWFHLLLSELIRNNRFRLPKRVPGYLLSQNLSYPALFHLLLALFPNKVRERIEPLIGPFTDALIGLGVFTATFYFSAIIKTPVNGIVAGWIAWGIYLITPGTLGIGHMYRILYASPRILGQFLFFSSTLALILFYLHHHYIWILVAVLLSALIFLSSMFTVQTLVFTYLLVPLFTGFYWPLVSVAVGFLLSLLLSGGRSLETLRGQIQHLRVFADSIWHNRTEHLLAGERNKIRDVLYLPVYLFKDFRRAIKILYGQNSIIFVIWQAPVLLLWAGFYILFRINGAPVLPELNYFILAMAIVFLFTSLKPFMFLGEPDRYIEHALPLLSIAAGIYLAIDNRYIHKLEYTIPFITLCLFFYSVNLGLFYRNYKINFKMNSSSKELLQWINIHANTSRFALFPTGNVLSRLIPNFTQASLLFGRWTKDSPPEYKALKMIKYPEFKQYIYKLMHDFKIEFIILYRPFCVYPNIQELTDKFPALWQNEHYIVLKRVES